MYREVADPDAIPLVAAAYTDHGYNFSRAAAWLTEAGLPIPRPKWAKGGRRPVWSATTVRRIILREAPELVTEWAPRSRTTRPRLFRKLLRCNCGTVMTPGAGSRSLTYYCNRAKRDPAHPHPHYISESKLRPWIEAEAARFDRSRILEVEGEVYDDSADRARLDAARDLIGDDAYAEATARLDAAREAHGGRLTTLRDLPDSIDWEGDDVQAVNDVLRAYWDHVQLGEDLLPVRAEWRFDPEATA